MLYRGKIFFIKSEITTGEEIEKIFKDVHKKYERDDTLERFKKALAKKLPKDCELIEFSMFYF